MAQVASAWAPACRAVRACWNCASAEVSSRPAAWRVRGSRSAPGQGDHPGTSRPAREPPTPWQQGRAPTEVRRRKLHARNVVKRAINKLKGHRAVATRYDKRDFMFQGTADVASIRIWLRDPSHDPRGTL